MKSIFVSFAACLLAACVHSPQTQQAPVNGVDDAKLREVLASQGDSLKARYSARHPYETLRFFGIAPGMTVVELLPGDGWYSKILLPYLGENGKLIGVDYPSTIWANFPFANEEFIAKRKQWPGEWTASAQQWNTAGAAVEAYALDQAPQSLNGTVDMVLFIRALHGMARVEAKGQFLTSSLARTYQLLKPGGLVGVVQHEAREDKSDTWADGNNGYLKRSYVKKVFEDAGFEFVGESEVNQNPKDQPTDEESVWRLPPSLSASNADPKLAEHYKSIGESNRMTLLFRKPN